LILCTEIKKGIKKLARKVIFLVPELNSKNYNGLIILYSAGTPTELRTLPQGESNPRAFC